MNGTYTRAERAHVERVKALACSVCDAPGPSEAHHVQQGLHYVAGNRLAEGKSELTGLLGGPTRSEKE